MKNRGVMMWAIGATLAAGWLFVRTSEKPKYEPCNGSADCAVCKNCSRCKWCRANPDRPCGVKVQRTKG